MQEKEKKNKTYLFLITNIPQSVRYNTMMTIPLTCRYAASKECSTTSHHRHHRMPIIIFLHNLQ